MISRLAVPLSIAVLLVAAAACSDNGGTAPTETPAEATGETPEATEANGATPSESPEQMLAAVSAGAAVAADDPIVGEFRAVLDILDEKCPDDRQDIADIGVSTHDAVTERGLDITLLQMLQDLSDNIPADLAVTGISCAIAFSAYVQSEAPQ